jgi:hypothetical protein
VNQEHTTALEPKNQIFAAATDLGYSFSFEFGGYGGRIEGSSEPRVGNVDVVEATAAQMRLQLHSDRLDLG